MRRDRDRDARAGDHDVAGAGVDRMAAGAADAARSPKRRDLSFEAVMERISGSGKTNPDAEYAVRLNRALFM